MNPILLAVLGISAAFGLYTAAARANTTATGALTSFQWVMHGGGPALGLAINQRFQALAIGVPANSDPSGPWPVECYAVAPASPSSPNVAAKVYSTPAGPLAQFFSTGQPLTVPMDCVLVDTDAG